MKLYHGTTEKYLKKILSEGIKPRLSRKGNWGHSVDSHSRAVYLTNAYAAYFAINATKRGRGLIVEIDSNKLETFLMCPDEDALEQVSRNANVEHCPKEWDMKKRTKWYRDRLEDWSGAQYAEASIAAIGNCCYMDTVQPHMITRVALIDFAKAPVLAMTSMDPSITILNYKFVGRKYRGLTKWIFNEDLGEDAPIERFTDEQINEAKFDVPREHLESMKYDYVLPPKEERKAIEIIKNKVS